MQEISLNPQKLAVQCGKLKCCLIYEVDAYMDARKEFPRIYNPLEALDGTFYHVKNDIFAKTMYFCPSQNGAGAHIPLSTERVKEIIRQNKQGKKVDKLEDVSAAPKDSAPAFMSGMEEDSITRFDPAKRSGNNRRRGGRGKNGNGEGNKPENGAQPNQNTGGPKPENANRPPRPECESRPPRRNNRNRNRKPPHEG
jgi:hypothetical protein